MRPAWGARGNGLALVAATVALWLAPSAVAGDVDLGTAGGVTYVQDDSSGVATGNPGFAEAYCPDGKELAGSGEWTTPALVPDYHLTSIAPSDGVDVDDDNDDAALIAVFNDTSTTAVVGSAYAICLDGKFKYRSKSATVITGFEDSKVTARCPRGTHVTGGGAVLDAAVGDAYLNSSYPIDGGDRDRKPDDGWRARAYATGTQRTLTAHAYCWNKLPRYKRYDEALNPGDTYGAPRSCQRHLLSGGIMIPGNASEARFLALAHPFDDVDDDSVPGDGVDIAPTNSSTGSPKVAKLWVICKR